MYSFLQQNVDGWGGARSSAGSLPLHNALDDELDTRKSK